MGDEIEYLKSELRTILGRSEAQAIPASTSASASSPIATRATNTSPAPIRSPPSVDEMQANLPPSAPTAAATIPRRWTRRWPGRSPRTGGPTRCKSLLLVADAPPHDENVAQGLERRRGGAGAGASRSCPVAASGVGDLAEYVMRAMAAATQSRYIFLTDDSGIGNPHAAAGGRLLPRHPARRAGPAGPRQPDLRPPGRAARTAR